MSYEGARISAELFSSVCKSQSHKPIRTDLFLHLCMFNTSRLFLPASVRYKIHCPLNVKEGVGVGGGTEIQMKHNYSDV